MDLEPGIISFRTFLIGQDFNKALILPPKFAANVEDLVDQEIRLEDSSGICCTVTLSYYKNLLAFNKGWYEFSVFKDLKEGDLLTFTSIKRGHFLVEAFGKNECEKINATTKHLPVKRARNSDNITAENTPCQTTYKDAWTSAKIQPTETNCTSNSEGGNVEQLTMDNEIYLMVDRDAGYVESDYKRCLYDLSTFEMQRNIGSAAQYKLDGQGGSPDLPNDLPPAAASVKGDDISNLAIPPLSSKRSRRILNKKIEMAKKDKVEVRKQAYGGQKKDKEIDVVVEDKVEMRKQKSGGGRKRVLETSAKAEGGSSLAASEKIVPVDSFDVPSAGASSLTSLPVKNDIVYIDLPNCLPSVTFGSGSWRAKVILEDPEGREWVGLFYDNLGFHLLLAHEWDKIKAENGIQPGDQLVFRVADASLNKYKFDVVRKQLEN